MIYLIGGPPKCGKTTLAKKLSKSTGISWVSADVLRQIARRYTDPSRHAEMFPINTIVKAIPKNNDLLYTRYSSEEIVDACKKQGLSCYGAIEIMAVSNEDYIIEGHQVTPELVQALVRTHGKNKLLRAIFLTKTDKDKLIQGFTRNPAPDDWIITGTKTRNKTFPLIANMITDYSDYFETEAKKYGFRVCKMDDDFDDQIGKAIDYLLADDHST